jgi:hypothetical protein
VIIGICGAAGAGKGAAADFLSVRGYATLSFADPLYDAVSAITGLTVAELKDRSRKEKALGWISASPRRLLQTLGTDWGREMIHPEIWVMATMQRMVPGGDYCIPDVRFANEAEAIRARGGVVWRVDRPGHAVLDPVAAGHSSEAGIPSRYIDGVIANTGSLGDLEAAIDRLLADIMAV